MISDLAIGQRPHPHQLEIQEFDQYDLIIDARSPREFAEDHVPGAVNLPVVDNDQYAEVGTTHKTDKHRAYVLGVAQSLRNMAEAIDTRIRHLPQSARILVYCFRGGKRSRLWTDTLRTIGFKTDVLIGGWKRYRRWVSESLATYPAQFSYRVLSGPTGCGKTRLLHALEAVGEQVLDLEGLASHRGSLMGAIPGVAQPSQKLFDSMVLQKLRTFDPERPVWVEAESKKIGQVQLPTTLYESMHRSVTCYALDAPMAERVRLWHEDFGHFRSDPEALLGCLRHLVPLVGREEFDTWRSLGQAGRMDELFERLMLNHYDPAYARTSDRNYSNVAMRSVKLPDLGPETLRDLAKKLADDSETVTGNGKAVGELN